MMLRSLRWDNYPELSEWIISQGSLKEGGGTIKVERKYDNKSRSWSDAIAGRGPWVSRNGKRQDVNSPLEPLKGAQACCYLG